MESVEDLQKQLEHVIRGKRVDVTALLQEAKDLYQWSRRGSMAVEISSEDSRLKNVNSAVMLYNKAKSIVPKHLSEVKTYAKGAAAWMLSAFCENKLKTVIICVKIHSRAAAEFLMMGMQDIACDHFAEAVRYWNKVNIATLERALSPIEIEELRHLMFGSLVDYAKLCRKNNADIENVRPIVGAAMEIVQALPSVRLQFIVHLIDIGYDYANEKQYMDGLHFFRVGLTVAELPIDQAQERKHMQLKLHLGCCFCYKELDDCEKALLHLHEAETLSAPMETTLFAHFSIRLRAGDVSQAGTYLLQLIRATHSYALVLNAVMMYTEYACDVSIVNDLFDALLQRFHQDPECTSTKICQLQWLLTSNNWMNSGVLLLFCSLLKYLVNSSIALLQSIVDSHALRPLNEKNFAKLLSIVYNHICYLHSEKLFDYIVSFTGIIRAILQPSTEREHYCNVTMYYIDALIRTNKFEEAFAASRQLLGVSNTTSTLLLHYKAALAHLTSLRDAADLIMAHLDADPATSLTQILLCVQITREEVVSDKFSAVEPLLCEYLRRYAASDLWDQNSATVKPYQKILCNLIHESIMECSLLDESTDVSELVASGKRIGSQDTGRDEVKRLKLDYDVEMTAWHENQGDNNDTIGNQINTTGELSTEADNDMSCVAKHTEDEPTNNADGFSLRRASSIEPEKVKTRFLDPLCLYLRHIENRQQSFHLEHSKENKWLADVAWNFGTMMMTSGNNTEAVENSNGESNTFLSYWNLAAEFFEIAQQLYELVDAGGNFTLDLSSAADNMRLKCLLTATSLRIDMHNIFQDEENFDTLRDNGGSATYSPERARNIAIARNNLETAALLTTPSNPVLLTLRLAFHCATSIPDTFISDNIHAFLQMTLSQMQRCVETVLCERVPAAICREFLHVAIQRAFQDTIPCYRSIGRFYCKLINLSPTRNEALQKVEEFEQLVRKDSNFDAEDINFICCMCYNWGVTLIQLEQVVLAEKFISKALNLYHYTSPDFAIWNETIQEAYLHILKIKSKSAIVGPSMEVEKVDAEYTSIAPDITMKSDVILSLNALGV